MTTDIALDDNLDLKVLDGDFVNAESDEQHIKLILLYSKGELKRNPLTGVAIRGWLNAPYTQLKIQELRQKIDLQLRFDGYTSTSVTVKSFDDFTINATRNG